MKEDEPSQRELIRSGRAAAALRWFSNQRRRIYDRGRNSIAHIELHFPWAFGEGVTLTDTPAAAKDESDRSSVQ